LYWCETWSPSLREEHRLRLFESRVLRNLFWPKRDKVTGEWRSLHNEELYDLYLLVSKYYSGHQIMKNERGRACGMKGEEKRCIKGFGWET